LITAPEGARRALEATREEGPAQAAVDDWLVPPAHGTALERLEIYANMYFYRLLDSLRHDCPRLLALIGDAHFHNLITDYLLAHPSRHASLRHLPRQLAAFLRHHPLSERWPSASDLAELEWARAGAFDAADATPISREQLASVPPERWPGLELEFAPSVRLLEVGHAVHELWRALDSGEPPPPAVPVPTTLLVWRQGFVVYHRPLSAAEACASRMVFAGATFGAVCAGLCELIGESQVAPTAAALIERWISDGLLGAMVWR
jgi:hypothetical protein